MQMSANRRSGTFLPAYLIVGADELKSKTAVARLKGHLEPGLEAFNLDERVARADLMAGDLLASLNTLPVGSGIRLVLVVEAEHLAKPTSEALIGYLRDPNPGCVLCLVAKTLAKSTRLYKAVKALGPHAVIDCAAKKPWEMGAYVQRMAGAHGLSLTDDAAEELALRVGESTTLLESQVRALAALKGGQGTATLEDVRAHVARTAEVKPWGFLDAVCARDLGRALEAYRTMQKPSQIGLVVMVERRLRELICAQSLAARGQGGLLAQTLGKNERAVRRYPAWARGFGPGDLEAGLAACASCERELKSGADVETSFLNLLAVVCR